MKFDAVIFDKDGTLIEFEAFWISISAVALKALLRELQREDIPVEACMAAMGVREGKTDPDAILLKGTYEDMGLAIHGVLTSYGCSISREEAIRRVLKVYTDHRDAGEVLPTCPGLAEALKSLYDKGIKMAVVTTDNEPLTRKCLQALGIEGLFERIYTDDGRTPTKPDPFCALDFCRRLEIQKERLLMVGDTMTDVKFARNAGITVWGVAKEQVNREFLAPHVDLLIRELRELPALLEE